MLSFFAIALFFTFWFAMNSAIAHAEDDTPIPVLVNGVAAGDVTQASAIIWTRSVYTPPANLNLTNLPANPSVNLHVVNIDNGDRFSASSPVHQTFITRTLDGLTPGSRYIYTMTNTVHVISGTSVITATSAPVSGAFRTPSASGHRGLRFGVAGDWRGELSPYPAIKNAPDLELDFFIELGDTICASCLSPALPMTRATTLDEFRIKYDEVYAVHHGLNAWADLRSSTAIFAMIDDNEVANNFAGGADVSIDDRFTETTGLINQSALFGNGLQAFHEFNPLRAEHYGDVGDARMDGRRKLYRYRAFGEDAALLLVDARSFRDEELAPVDAGNQLDILRFLSEAYDPTRTMLGSSQFETLKVDLLDAEARGITWKFVALPEPAQNLGPAGAEDRFEGYAAERAALLEFIQARNIRNVVFIAADLHGTIVNNLTYQEGFSLTAPQEATSVFEVTTGAVAVDAPFGPRIVDLALDLGLIDAEEKALYDSLPVASDPDDIVDDKDDFVKEYINLVLNQLGYDAVGLSGSPVDAQLLEGDYLNVHTFGWTEFEIAADSQRLTVTTYGIPPYTVDDLAVDPVAVVARTPAVISRFVITPTFGAVGAMIYLPLVQGQ